MSPSCILIEQIQNNDIKVLKIDDTDEYMIDDVKQLVMALEQNTSIVAVHFEGEYLGCLRKNERSDLAQTVGKLPNLQELHMSNTLFVISDICTLVKTAPSLRVLKLNNFVLQGVKEEFENCETLLYSHAALKDLQLKDCKAANDDIALDKLEVALLGKKVSMMSSVADQDPVTRNAMVA